MKKSFDQIEKIVRDNYDVEDAKSMCIAHRFYHMGLEDTGELSRSKEDLMRQVAHFLKANDPIFTNNCAAWSRKLIDALSKEGIE